MEYLEKSCETAKFLNAPCVTIHSNGLGDGGIVINHYDNLSNTVKTCTMFRNLEKCAALAEKTGIQMNLEGLNITTDHVGNFLRYTQDAAEMIRLIGSPKLKVLYDAHSAMCTLQMLPDVMSPAPVRSIIPGYTRPSKKSATTHMSDMSCSRQPQPLRPSRQS